MAAKEEKSHVRCSVCEIILLKNLSTFRVPKHQFENWKKLIKNLKPNGIICEKHFDVKDIRMGRVGSKCIQIKIKLSNRV